jgi:hypothetical protein
MARIAALLLALVLGVALALHGIGSGWLGHDEVAGKPAGETRPESVADAIAAQQRTAVATLGADASKQILFGDFHVHTTFSFDAFMVNLPMAGGPGSHPPADACDFARFCSDLDFWSINDHAENLTPRLWKETVKAVRQCNEIAGDPANPDLVTYLGWEWSHIGTTPENHYGHKNVVLLETGDGRIPTRPIGARSPATANVAAPSLLQRLALVALNGQRGNDWARFVTEFRGTPRCPDDVPVRALPDDCLETAPDPQTLFAKLDDWGLPALVIPHGTAWGMYTPAGSDWRKQLPTHDPSRQKLIEIYSGHGNSEQLPDWREVDVLADGSYRCPEPRDGYLPSCWRAGQILEANCLADGVDAATCTRRAADARRNYVDAFQAGWRTLPGQPVADWLDAGQAPDMFQPAFNYRPRSSVQYMLAIRDFSDPAHPQRFDFGFLGSSDSHTARPGTGYKELARGEMSDGRGAGEGTRAIPGLGSPVEDTEPVNESVPFVSHGESPLQLFEIERASAYMVTGGLVAVHAKGRDRRSIWDALERKEVYATSGRRTLLWFDLIDGARGIPMGSTVQRSRLPRFRVRALGSFEQKPGCPEEILAALGPERVEFVCRGECYNPGDARRPITRIEVVRIRPQQYDGEPLDGLVDDPWRVFPCPADGLGCVVEFADPGFAAAGRDTVYYVRAIEAPDLLIHGSNPLRCSYDAEGHCVSVDPCGATAPAEDDCLSEGEPRAWSSPIYVDHAPVDAPSARPGPQA